ncbi:MAG TPA: c-type cytochrome [Bryobacteraceae bacterium]|jgi:mono/diheme cytochrome c family protein
MTIKCAIFFAIATLAFAQEPDGAAPPGPGARRGAGRGMRGAAGTREFLGLGSAPDPAEAKKGEPLYKQNCATCHGEDARGSQGPNLVRSIVVLHDEKDEEIGPIIKTGRPQGGMPGFPQLSQAQIHSIAQFLKMQVELAANRGTYGQTYNDLRNKITGDPQKGAAFFKANCTACHSATGDLAKIGDKFQQPSQLQQRFLWPASFGPAHATVTTRSGEKVSGTISREDDFTISLRDASGEYHVWPLDQVTVEIPDKLRGHRALLAKYSDADIHNMTAYLVTLK